MENPDQDMMKLQSFSAGLNTGVSPGQEQQNEFKPENQPEYNQKTPELKSSPPPLAVIKFRIQQLQNRRCLLLTREQLRRKPGNSGYGALEEPTCKGGDEQCELEAVQKELEELTIKKEELEKCGTSWDFTANEGQQYTYLSSYETNTPHGGIYMLPPPELTQEETSVKTDCAAAATGPIIPVECLGHVPALTRCPSCEELIFTETHSTVSQEMWLLCCLCSIMGCIAGCCLLPFFMDRLRTVNHRCPRCQIHIQACPPF